jgi:hypothetical protein
MTMTQADMTFRQGEGMKPFKGRTGGTLENEAIAISPPVAMKGRAARRSHRALPGLLAAVVSLAAGHGSLRGQTITVPNGSFESPVTLFVTNQVDSWQKTPKPFWYDESGGYLWDQLTGLFTNTSPTNSDHIDNCDGAQAIYVFAVPQVGFLQDYDSIDSTHTTPTHDFDVRFEVGNSYRLIVGVIGGAFGMTNGASLELSLYYRDGLSNQVTVAATNIVYTPTAFPTTTHFVDCEVRTPPVKAGDPWAGQHLGIQVLSTVDPALVGGYWDLDHVRLVAVSEPVLLNPHPGDGHFAFTLQSEPGLRFDVLASPNATLPVSEWTHVGTVTNTAGTSQFSDPRPATNGQFYQARQLP